MNKIGTLFLVLCLICASINAVIAEPILPKYVVPLNNNTNVRSETSQTGNNIVLQVGIEDVLQVIGYSYDMESNLWWRVIDYRSNKDGYTLAALYEEINESQAEEKKKRIDTETPTPMPTPTPKPTPDPTPTPTLTSTPASETESVVKKNGGKYNIPIFNENFIIRNSIGYNSTIDEVYDAEMAYESYNIEKRSASKLACNTMLVGTEVLLTYDFGESGTLSKVRYILNRTNFSDVVESVENKYGDPLFDGWYLDCWNSEGVRGYKSLSFFGSTKLLAYSGWLCKYEDCYVYIDAIKYTSGSTSIEEVNYSLLSYEEAQAAITQYEEYMHSAQTSESNDL